MNKNDFKRILKTSLCEKGFAMFYGKFYKMTDSMIVVIDSQKSNYDEKYYINYGFFIKSLHNASEHPSVCECDVRGRFHCICEDGIKDSFILREITEDIILNSIENGFMTIINPVISKGIIEYFNIYPNAINACTLRLKEYINNL